VFNRQNDDASRSALSPVKRLLLESRLKGEATETRRAHQRLIGEAPASFAQERFWFLDRIGQGGVAYHQRVVIRLLGSLDVAALERALAEIVRRHDALRTTFREVDGVLTQVIAAGRAFELPLDILSPAAEGNCAERVAAETAHPFDLEEGPLFRARLLRSTAEDHVLIVCVHHIVSDAWSLGILKREMWVLYRACLAGRESPLPEPAVQYVDHAVRQRSDARGARLARDLAYWRAQLAGAPALLPLPTDRPRPATPSLQGGRVHLTVPPAVVEGLRHAGRQADATLFMVVLAAFNVLLCKFSGCEDVVVGSPVAGRTRHDVQNVIGLFMNTLVLRTDVSGDPTFRELLARVRELVLGAYDHQDVPFEQLVADIQPERSLNRSALFQVLFQMQTADASDAVAPDLRVQALETSRCTAKFDLTLNLTASVEGIGGVLEYSTDLFER
jgi:hypothetical protein